jgi:hypothetical protein
LYVVENQIVSFCVAWIVLYSFEDLLDNLHDSLFPSSTGIFFALKN